MLLLMLSSPGFGTEPGPARTVLVLGDSISAAYGIQREQGWVTLLDERLKTLNPAHRVINASVSGDTTGGGLARLPDALALHEPDIVVIELGGNDALRGYPVDRIARNLDAMTTQVSEVGAKVVIAGMQIPPNYGPRYTESFFSAFADVAQRHQATLIPFLLDGIATDEGLMQGDGIHPTAAAQPRILDNVWPLLAPLL